MKTCVHCNIEKPYTEYHKKRSNVDGYSGICKDCRRVYNNKWRKDNIEHVRNYDKLNTRKLRKCPKTRMYKNLTSRISHKRKLHNFNTLSIPDMLGCTKEFLYDHIEKQFKTNMSWDNYTKEWEIDHEIPLYKVKDSKHFEELNHYTNLRPLDPTQNRTRHYE